MAERFICKIENCNKPHEARGWCSMHYQRWRNHGDPLGGRTAEGEPERYLREVILSYEGDECLTWPFSKGKNGYGQIWHDGSMQLVSRIVCAEVHGAAPTPRHQAAHSCGKGNESCVTKAHLDWKTPSENQADRLIHGTHGRGERCLTSKLTDNDIREIRNLRGYWPQAAIAARFNITVSSVSMIQSRKRWSWLE